MACQFHVSEWANLDHLQLKDSSKFLIKPALKTHSFYNPMLALEQKQLVKMRSKNGNASQNKLNKSLALIRLEMQSMLPRTAKQEIKNLICSLGQIFQQPPFLTIALVLLLSPMLLHLDMQVKSQMQYLKKASKYQLCRCLTQTNQRLKNSLKSTAECYQNIFQLSNK